MPRSRANKGTTRIGYTNEHGDTVIRKTDQPGNDHNQVVYVPEVREWSRVRSQRQ